MGVFHSSMRFISFLRRKRIRKLTACLLYSLSLYHWLAQVTSTLTDFLMGNCIPERIYETPDRSAACRARSSSEPVSSNLPAAINSPPMVNQASNASVFLLSYTNGEITIHIQFPINPWKILGLKSASTRDDVKLAFKKLIANASLQNKALVSLGNHILTSTAPRYQKQQGTNLYTIKKLDHFTVAAYGDTDKLRRMIERNPSLIESVDEHGRTLLYLACKSGFVDIVSMLLRNGADKNKIQRDGSTPLHAAAYFGHPKVVQLLIKYGARTEISNSWEKTAWEESATTEIRNMIENPPPDPINSLARMMEKRKLIKGYRTEKDVIEFIRHPDAYDDETRAKLREYVQSWKLTWHGTRYKNLESIMEHGLLPAGKNGIKPPPGHFALGKEYQGIQNWAAAIFVSPSIWYAADKVYAEKVISRGDEWCVLIKAYCKPDSYKRYDPTIFSYERMENEPVYPEYRVPVVGNKKDHETVFLRVESERNVVVRSVVFISTRKLEDRSITFDEMTNIFKES